MTTIARNVPLPREMQHHTYAITYEEENKHWWFVGRRRIIAGFVENIFRRGKFSHPRILDVGCGTGANLELLSQFGAAEGVDISQQAIDFCRLRGLERVRMGAAEELPYEDGSFDLLTALDVVEHLDDDVAGLREMRRVLRTDGRILLFVPAFMFLWGVQDDISHHRRRYTREGLRRAVVAAGFEIERLTYANLTFFVPTLLGRLFMRATGWRPASEANINIAAMNGALGQVLGAERHLLDHTNLPFGVSLICVARRDTGNDPVA